jgi:hypothetical protein
MEKRRTSIVANAVVIAIVAVMFLAGAFAIYKFSNAVSPNEPSVETIIVVKQPGAQAEFTNGNEGTISIQMRATEADLDIGGTNPTKIQLFRSKIVDGLAIDYHWGSKNVTAGIPQLTSPPINLLDNNLHTIIYSFKRGEKQILVIDGVVVDEGEFGTVVKQSLTGFLIKTPSKQIESELPGVQVKFYDKMVDVNTAETPESTS